MTPPATDRGNRIAVGVATAVPLAFFAAFFAYPVASILGRGLAPDGALDLGPLADVVGDPHLRGVLWFTLWQAALSTAVTLVLGVPGAAALARFEFPGRSLVRALVVVPFVLPTVVVGTAFLSLGFEPSLMAMLTANVFFNYAVVVRVVGGLWAYLDPRQEDAARVLGAGRARTFLTVTLPALRPALVSAAAIVFLFTFTSFGVVLVLGGPTRSTLETEIYRQTAQLLDLPQAAALTIVQMAAVVAMLVVTGWTRGRRARALGLQASTPTARRPRGGGAMAFVGVNLAVMAILIGTPLAVLVERSLHTASGYGLGYYRALGSLDRGSTLFVPPTEAIRNTLVFACIATALAMLIGGLTALAVAHRVARGSRFARALAGVLVLPLGVSAVTVGFGFLIALDDPPLDLRSSPVLVPIAHALVAVPFVVLILLPVLESIDPRLREAAGVLGAGPSRVRREIDAPIAARAGLVAAGFAFAVSVGEFGATAFIARPDRPTLPVLVYRLLGQPGPLAFGQAMAASVILMLLTAAGVLAFERLRVGAAGEL